MNNNINCESCGNYICECEQIIKEQESLERIEEAIMKCEARVTQVTVLPEGKPLYDSMATRISIINEGGREYVLVESGSGGIKITPQEWPEIANQIYKMISTCRDSEGKS